MSPVVKKKCYTIAYLAHGLESTKYQAILAIYTFYHHVRDTDIDVQFVIYTDSDTSLFTKYLHGLPVQCEVLSKADIKHFRGPYDYVFRVKPHVIQACFAKYQRNLLYLDTDTFFLRNPLPLLNYIQPGHSIMNAEEYDFVDAGGGEMLHWFYQRQALKQHTYMIQGQATKIPLHTKMWNAGIMGISLADAGLVEAIISLNDAMYEKAQTFIVEQFAASYILQTFTKMRSSEDFIEHYWLKGVKNTFNIRIPEFLRENAGRQGVELYQAAFDFALATRTVHTPYHEPLLSRVRGRLKAIATVARKGHL